MKLRGQTVYSKALAIFVALSFALGGGVVWLAQMIIAREFRQTEVREVGASVLRLELMLTRELANVELSLVEIVALEAEGHDSSQASSPKVDFLAVGNSKVGMTGWHPFMTSSERLKLDMGGLFVAIARFAQESRMERSSGFAFADGSLVALAWMPGPAAGELRIAGRLIAGETLAFLESLFLGKIAFESLGDRVLGVQGSESLLEALTTRAVVVEEPTEAFISGLALIYGIDRTPIGAVRLTQERTLSREGERSVNIFLTVMVLAGGLLFLAVWVLLDRTILKRVRELTIEVESCREKGELPKRLNFGGSDELATLARRIESLATLLDKVQAQYRDVVNDQTEIICRFDQHFRITFANAVFRRRFPMPSVLDAPLAEALPPMCWEALRRVFRALTPEASIEIFQHPLEGGANGGAWLRSTLRATFDDSGNPLGGQWVAADVTAQVAAEQSVQDSERQLRVLSGKLMHLQDEERRRIARELHDSTAQSLSALEMNVSLLEPLATDSRTKRIVSETRQIATHCCQELRNISYLLHPPLLDEVGLGFALRWFLDGFTERCGIAVDLQAPEAFPRLAPDVETALFRIVQEAMSNIYRHSGATQARVTLDLGPEGLSLAISDNGNGFPPPGPQGASRPPGIGLAGMRERLSQFHGKFSVESSSHGVHLSVSIPTDHLYGG